ncbi:nucleotidyltransferase domain-containing protein [Nocardioides sp. KIGAM211]|uniref:Nucleotidyltransferase domain-containing protein n=1 Tax=Nocardioides luti TaxID=2761101 RepID=A0A7X0RFD9_9ACTN|nr:nucleotidyltransferase domain-containing protein [Nocardioides luti]MBB6626315.1 nucleotidyltransferase domain-containing protein [Nocardioides luti]
MDATSAALEELRVRVVALGWVTDLLVAGSLATGDHRPGVSDLDLVALVDGPMSTARVDAVAAMHRELDAGVAAGLALGCVYVDATRLTDATLRHPTWTHGRLVDRVLSRVTRAELVRHGHALQGRAPSAALPAITDDEVRYAVRADLAGYWTWAIHRPWLWLDTAFADLSLTTMARARHTLATGTLLTKTAALDHLAAPPWLRDQVRARRNGTRVRSPRVRTAAVGWVDAVRTVARARHRR